MADNELHGDASANGSILSLYEFQRLLLRTSVDDELERIVGSSKEVNNDIGAAVQQQQQGEIDDAASRSSSLPCFDCSPVTNQEQGMPSSRPAVIDKDIEKENDYQWYSW